MKEGGGRRGKAREQGGGNHDNGEAWPGSRKKKAYFSIKQGVLFGKNRPAFLKYYACFFAGTRLSLYVSDLRYKHGARGAQAGEFIVFYGIRKNGRQNGRQMKNERMKNSRSGGTNGRRSEHARHTKKRRKYRLFIYSCRKALSQKDVS